MKPNILAFDDWQEVCINDTLLDQLVICPSCDGEGETLEDCPCCGHETEETCGICDGDGKVIFSDLSDGEQKSVYSKQVYIDQVINDITALANWTNEDRDKLLIEAGFTIYNRTDSKREVITIQE